MKKVAVLALLASTAISMASIAEKTTLEFELQAITYVNNREVKVNIADLNRTLEQRGLSGLPEIVIVSENAKPYWKVLMKRIEDANRVVETQMLFSINSGYLYEYPAVCYRGAISGVVKVIDGMSDNFLTSEQGILAIRYGKTKIIRSDEFKSEKKLRAYYEGNADEEVNAWLDFDEISKSVLVMSNLGPQGDGTELYATKIKPCEK